MKCQDVQHQLSAYVVDGLDPQTREAIREHVADCVVCRELSRLHRDLNARMEGGVAAPESLRRRVEDHIARPTNLLTPRGTSTMKKIAFSAAAAASLATLALIAPRTASASTPKETFERMGYAIAQTAQQGGLALNVKSDANGQVTVLAFLDGKALPSSFPLVTEVTRKGTELLVHIKVDFDPANYSDIRFGEDTNTLELVRKGAAERAVVKLDPKSARPTAWASQMKHSRTWKTTGEAKLSSPKEPISVEGFPLFYKLDAKVLMHLSSEARIEVRPSAK